jgi:hypothetical protein
MAAATETLLHKHNTVKAIAARTGTPMPTTTPTTRADELWLFCWWVLVCWVGLNVGLFVDMCDGATLGLAVGAAVGLLVGALVGDGVTINDVGITDADQLIVSPAEVAAAIRLLVKLPDVTAALILSTSAFDCGSTDVVVDTAL